MKLFRMEDMTGGWFVGGFTPTAFHTDQFEVSVKTHPKGERWDRHYHKVATEINVLLQGQMTMCNTALKPGDIFVVEPNEIADPEFLEPCVIVCVKTPCVLGDKYLL